MFFYHANICILVFAYPPYTLTNEVLMHRTFYSALLEKLNIKVIFLIYWVYLLILSFEY